MNKLLSFLKKTIGQDAPFYKRFPISIDKQIIENSLAISHKHKYLYTRIYKAANSTIVSSLYYAETNQKINSTHQIQDIKDNYFVKPSHLSRDDLNKLLKLYYKFTFCRHPLSRFVSCYLDKVLPIDKSQRKLITHFLDIENSHHLSIDMFLTFLEEGDNLKLNGHWAPQTNFLVIDPKSYNFIGKIENLKKDIEKILCNIYPDTTPEIVNIQDHKTNSQEFISSLSDDQLNRIYKLYEEDYDTFSYSTNLYL